MFNRQPQTNSFPLCRLVTKKPWKHKINVSKEVSVDAPLYINGNKHRVIKALQKEMVPSDSKRSSHDGSGNGSKRNGAKSVVIRVRESDPSVDPILCSFPGGLPAALQDDMTYGASLPEFIIKKQQRGTKLLVGKDHACLYMASASFQAVCTPNRPMQMCVAIYDKETNEMILQPTAEGGFVYAMSQSVPSYTREVAEAVQMNPAERRKALFEDFGSAKKRKVLKSQEANRVNVESVVGAGNVNSILQTMSESNRQAVEDQRDPQERLSAADQAALEWRKNFLPEYNETADEPSGVYSIKKIAGPAVWNRLMNIVNACLQKEDVLNAIIGGPPPPPTATAPLEEAAEDDKKAPTKVKPQEWNSSVIRIITRLVHKGQDAKTQIFCALLLNHYVNLYKTLHGRRFISGIGEGGRNRFFGAPLEVGQRWLESFTTPVAGREGQAGHVMSKANKDSCCVHMFLMLLMAEGGDRMRTENIQPLAEDLQMDVQEASHLLRLAGCTVARKGDQTTAILTTPLKFPLMKKAGRKR